MVGTIPSEIGLLTDLAILNMEQGNLTGTIPTELGLLQDLIYIDLDFNELTGTLTPELLSLTKLTQLDLNNNKLSGSVNGIGVFPAMEFLQLSSNLFTGTIPAEVGTYNNLLAFTIHETNVTGNMPPNVCDLLVSNGNGGRLGTLIADCRLPDPKVNCTCCTDCRRS